MSDAFYSGLAGVASDVLDRFKQGEVKFVRSTRVPSGGDFPDSVTETAPVEHVVSAAVRGVSADELANTSVTAKDLVVIIPAFSRVNGVKAAFEPLSTDKVIVRGSGMDIKQITRVPGSGPAISYQVVVAS